MAQRVALVSLVFTFTCFEASASFRAALDEPIQLVRPDLDHRKLVLVRENIKLITHIQGPVATIAVVGKFHSGKSFLMNQLMGKSKGFGIGPTVRPETMGIWMWGQPMKIRLPSGEAISLIFLDTEGFAANNISENYDAKIFAVATLISSHLIYNSVKIIDQADIDYLELLARRTQLFALRSQLSRAKWSDGFVHDLLSFPPLLWVVQDFVQQTLDNESPTEWLHRLMNTHSRESEEYKISLLDIFKSLECHTLFLPAVKRLLLADLSQAEESDLTEEYIKEREALSQKLRSSLKPKTKNGRPINGVELAGLFEILVNASNDGSLTDVPSRWNSFVEKITQSSTEDCLMFYESEMRVLFAEHDEGAINEAELIDWHEQAMNKSFTLLNQLLHGLTDTLETATVRLRKSIESTHARQRDMNTKKIKLFCLDLSQKEILVVEEYLKSVQLPLQNSELEKLASAKVEEQLREFSDKLGRLISEQEKETYRKTFVCGHLFSIFCFCKQVFDDECTSFKTEKDYSKHEALLKEIINREIEKLKKENERLVSHLIASTASKLSANYEDQTGPSHLSLPVNDTELDIRLQGEGDNMRAEFGRTLEDFSVFPTYRSAFKDLTERIAAVDKQRRAENVEALKQVVYEPLKRAKQVILVSADMYTTEFKLRGFIMQVCLLQLDEGKPKFWQDELKRNIVMSFMNTDEELSKRIRQVKGLWSSFLGFFQWLLWLVGW
ncbi:guanylate-binding protein 2-like [Ornithodoros turicata]|uniref:guanylate-binding protein 2-like n=1 Tax=Ornithodoros turicata TaxID=34597 RepID=UPI00313A17DD